MCFSFWSVKNSGCYSNLHSILTYNGKKRKFTIFSLCFFFTKMFIEFLRFIRLLSKSLNLIGCQGDKKAEFEKNMLKNLLLRNHKVDEADTLHTCL